MRLYVIDPYSYLYPIYGRVYDVGLMYIALAVWRIVVRIPDFTANSSEKPTCASESERKQDSSFVPILSGRPRNRDIVELV